MTLNRAGAVEHHAYLTEERSQTRHQSVNRTEFPMAAIPPR